MTGNEVKALRTVALRTRTRPNGWDRIEFGRLVGCSSSAIRRWELCCGETAKIEPTELKILTHMQLAVSRAPDGFAEMMEIHYGQDTPRLHYILGGAVWGDAPWLAHPTRLAA